MPLRTIPTQDAVTLRFPTWMEFRLSTVKPLMGETLRRYGTEWVVVGITEDAERNTTVTLQQHTDSAQ